MTADHHWLVNTIDDINNYTARHLYTLAVSQVSGMCILTSWKADNSSDKDVFVRDGLTISISFDKVFFTLRDGRRADAFCFQQSFINLPITSSAWKKRKKKKNMLTLKFNPSHKTSLLLTGRNVSLKSFFSFYFILFSTTVHYLQKQHLQYLLTIWDTYATNNTLLYS